MIIAKNERGLKDQIRLILDKWSNFSEEDNAARFNQYLGLRLRLRRIAMGLTQTKVAHMLNVTFQQIQKYEKGTNSCSGFTMLCLFKGVGVSIPELIKIYLSVPVQEIQGRNKPEKILLGQNQTPNNLSRSSDYVDVDTQSKSV